ncbi:MAG: hypothetical protein JWN34_221 [Bryobacterales bacterium]|nr:hypothetical protein [Bryobacterales bacterium]
MNRLVKIVALALEAPEREVVLGDLAECGSPVAGALLDVSGLVLRRQLLIWTTWRPWLALIGVAGVSGYHLGWMHAALSMALFQQTAAWKHYGVHYNTGVTSFRDQVTHMTALAAAIFCWTAVNGSLLRRLSGRAGWLTWLVFYLAVFYFPAARILSSSGVDYGNQPWWATVRWLVPHSAESAAMVAGLFVIPFICGVLGKIALIKPITILCTIAAAILGGSHAHDLEAFSSGTFPAASWHNVLGPYLLAGWPVLIVARILRPTEVGSAGGCTPLEHSCHSSARRDDGHEV